MTDRPFFSIVIPVYNRAEVVAEAVRSCVAQTFRDFEIVVVDDGSADPRRLAQTLEPFADIPLRLVRQDNAGAAVARNTGIDTAQGRYVAFLDSDDRFLPHKLERFHAAIGGRASYAGFAPALVDRGLARQVIRPAERLRPGEDLGSYFYARNQMVQTSMLVVDRDTAAAVRFQREIKVGEDLDFCLAVDARGLRWEMLDEPLSIWTDTPSDGRSSQYRGSLSQEYRSYRTWQNLSPRARHAYEGTVGAFHTASHRPLKALGMLARGPLLGGVPLKVAGRQFLRCFLPRKTYHRIVASVIGKRGGKAL